MNRSVLIVGCGYLGRRAAKLWLERGRTVWALTRRNSRELSSLGVQPVLGDVLEPGSLESLPRADTLLYAVGLDRKDGRSMREVYVEGLANVLKRTMSIRRIIYVSSTSVYGQTDGSWVDEGSPTEPLEESGHVVLEAEQMLLHHRPDAVRLRFAGIYGPDRLLRRQAILNGEPLGGDPDKWLNLIHVDDGASQCLAAEASAGQLFNIADDQPRTRKAFYSALASLLHAPAPRFDGPAPGRETHRRIRNSRMRSDLAPLAYPDSREGLPAAVLQSEPAVASESGSSR